MNTTQWAVGIVILVIIAVGAFLLVGSKQASAPTQTQIVPVNAAPSAPPQTNATPVPSTLQAPAAGPVTVTYTNTGFSPKTTTIKAGESITFTNQSNDPMWVASNAHPSHTSYDGTSRAQHCAPGYSGPAPFDECVAVSKGAAYTFTFTKIGTWGYHNHVEPEEQGAVVVTP